MPRQRRPSTKIGRKAAGPADKVIGGRIRQLRQQLDMSQDALGKEVGLSFQQIQKYESGKNRLSVTRMLEFCEHLQTTPNEIVGWTGLPADVPINNFSNDIFSAARDFSQLPKDLQITVRKLCDQLLPYVVKSKKRRGVGATEN